MSTKNVNKSVDIPVKVSGRVDPRMVDGKEVGNPVSRTVACYLPTMSERIHRYTREPLLQRDVYDHPDYWDDPDVYADFSEDTAVSIHDERIKNALPEAKKKKAERDEKERLDRIEAEKAEKEAFRLRVREAMSGGETSE